MSYPYTLLRVRPNTLRGESMNIGLVVFLDRSIIVRVEPDMARLRALDPNLPALPIWHNLAEEIGARITPLPSREMQLMMLRDFFTPIRADERLGSIEVADHVEIEAHIERLMDRLVRRQAVTERLPRLHVPRASRLNGQLKHWFKSAHILSRNAADLSRSKVVENFPISASHDLYAEFALKNGAVHVVETLDLRHHGKINAFVQKEAAIKAITLDQARQMLGAEGKRIAVIAADDYGAMRPAIGMLSGYADDVVTMASQADRQRFADFIATALHSDTALIALTA